MAKAKRSKKKEWTDERLKPKRRMFCVFQSWNK